MMDIEDIRLELSPHVRGMIERKFIDFSISTPKELQQFAVRVIDSYSEMGSLVGIQQLPDINSIADYFESLDKFLMDDRNFDIEHFCDMCEEYHNERITSMLEEK